MCSLSCRSWQLMAVDNWQQEFIELLEGTRSGNRDENCIWYLYSSYATYGTYMVLMLLIVEIKSKS